MSALRKLSTTFHDKVWGTTQVEPWYSRPDHKTGEVWFETVDAIPLLLKFIFTSERLSIQVHPDDAAAQRMGEPRGKTEMWYVLRSDPGATIGIGLRERVSKERLREACLSGEIEQLVDWLPVQPGDVIFVPAGAIHAIGAGLAVCEIQQLSDTTYRLYDYGRPRELHLDQGVEASDPGPHPGKTKPSSLDNGVRRLAESAYFVTDEIALEGPYTLTSLPSRQQILIAIEGTGKIGEHEYRAGEAWLVDAPAVQISPDSPTRFVRTYAP